MESLWRIDMAENALQHFQGKANAKLVKFLEESENFAKLTIKLIRMISMMAEEQHLSADELTYEVAVPKGYERITGEGGAIIAIKVIKPVGIL